MSKINQNAPYLLHLLSDEKEEFLIVAEREIFMDKMTELSGSLLNLICAYFSFDICYPTTLYPVFIFIQHHIMGIVDEQKVPDVVTRAFTTITELEHVNLCMFLALLFFCCTYAFIVYLC